MCATTLPLRLPNTKWSGSEIHMQVKLYRLSGLYLGVGMCYKHVTTINEKRAWIWKRTRGSVWEDLKGRKGREKCYNYIIISKRNLTKMRLVQLLDQGSCELDLNRKRGFAAVISCKQSWDEIILGCWMDLNLKVSFFIWVMSTGKEIGIQKRVVHSTWQGQELRRQGLRLEWCISQWRPRFYNDQELGKRNGWILPGSFCD